MPTIAYDRRVENHIAGLNATGHVTHTKHRKSKVTIHHNGGRLSLLGILNVWKTRPASAHFQVDGRGAVGQYVNVNEYAWATGTTKGNQESISIEMANSATGGDWPVSETTWHNAARLCAWLHWKVIGARPTRASVRMHKDWKSTACPGLHMTRRFDQFIKLSQWWYDKLRSGGAKPAVKPKPVPAKPTAGKKSIAQIAAEVLDGKWGNGDIRRRRLTAAGYNVRAVQAEVNRRVAGGAPHSAPKSSLAQVAQEVIDGEWGNGETRKHRLESAGYNYNLVQAEVNRRLR